MTNHYVPLTRYRALKAPPSGPHIVKAYSRKGHHGDRPTDNEKFETMRIPCRGNEFIDSLINFD